jgi:hypothetical protein
MGYDTYCMICGAPVNDHLYHNIQYALTESNSSNGNSEHDAAAAAATATIDATRAESCLSFHVTRDEVSWLTHVRGITVTHGVIQPMMGTCGMLDTGQYIYINIR